MEEDSGTMRSLGEELQEETMYFAQLKGVFSTPIAHKK